MVWFKKNCPDCEMIMPVFQVSSCHICGKSLYAEDFQRVPPDPRRVHTIHDEEPLYWASKVFHPNLEFDILFCSPTHSLQWYQKNFDNNTQDQ